MKKKIENIEGFVRQNAAFMTKNDMVEESGWSEVKIREILERFKLKPLGQKEKISNYILENYKKKSIDRIAKCCNICVKRVYDYYNELGIKEPDFPKPKPEKEPIASVVSTIAKRLAEVRHQDSKHWHDAENFKLL